MIPPLIVQEAVDLGIQLIAITDHNATGNIAAVMKAAEGKKLTVLPGMELQTIEEVHCLCLFDTLEQAQALQSHIDPLLPNIPNQPEHFGEQFYVDETGDFLAREDRLLITSAQLSFDDAFELVNSLHGLFIPAHVNRKAFGLLANLGLVPPHLPIEALELSRHLSVRQAREQYKQLANYPLIQSGDVHMLDSFLGVNLFNIETPTIAEIRQALKNENGRTHRVLSTTGV